MIVAKTCGRFTTDMIPTVTHDEVISFIRALMTLGLPFPFGLAFPPPLGVRFLYMKSDADVSKWKFGDTADESDFTINGIWASALFGTRSNPSSCACKRRAKASSDSRLWAIAVGFSYQYFAPNYRKQLITMTCSRKSTAERSFFFTNTRNNTGERSSMQV